MSSNTNPGLDEQILKIWYKEFPKRMNSDHMPQDLLDNIKALITKSNNEARIKVWDRVALETRANICECGEKWSETDLGVMAEDRLQALHKEIEE